MMERDDPISLLLKTLEDMGVANDRIVVYTTDNGPHMNTWPDGHDAVRSEKNTNWEGAFHIPCLVRWPGVARPGTVSNEIMSHDDWIPTLCAIAGEPEIVAKCRTDYTANGITYKVHLDGYDQSASARSLFFYSDDDGLLVGLRKEGTLGVWAEPFTTLRLQKIFNLMQDPFERTDITSNTFWDWQLNQIGGLYGAMDEAFQFVDTFKAFPPRSFPPSLNPANILESVMNGIEEDRRLKGEFDVERIRQSVNKLIEQQLQERRR